jgi:hypothetical protein
LFLAVAALSERLAKLAPNGRIDCSDSLSDEDLSEFRAAALHRLESEERAASPSERADTRWSVGHS